MGRARPNNKRSVIIYHWPILWTSVWNDTVKMHWYCSNSLILLEKKIDSTVNRPILCVLVTLMNMIWTTSQHGGCQAQPISHIVGGDRNGWRSRRVGWIISPCVYSIDSNIYSTCFHIYIHVVWNIWYYLSHYFACIFIFSNYLHRFYIKWSRIEMNILECLFLKFFVGTLLSLISTFDSNRNYR